MIVIPISCDGGCGDTLTPGHAIVVSFANRPGCYCDECASEIALHILDGTPGVTARDVHAANVVIAIVNARRKARIEKIRSQRDSATGPQLPAPMVLGRRP